MAAQWQQLERDVGHVAADIQCLRAKRTPNYVQNIGSGVYHAVRVAGMDTHPATWSSRCGWRFNTGRFALVSTCPS
eukprot:5927275-Amphidinium_carterae.1